MSGYLAWEQQEIAITVWNIREDKRQSKECERRNTVCL